MQKCGMTFFYLFWGLERRSRNGNTFEKYSGLDRKLRGLERRSRNEDTFENKYHLSS